MEKLKLYLFIFLLISFQACENRKPGNNTEVQNKLILGSDKLIHENIRLIKNKKLGIVANRASILSNGVTLVDTLSKINGINIRAIFAPEHGYSINVSAGENSSDSADKNIPVYSLYGRYRKPSPEMLKDIDLIIYDLQDTGTRFYTYITTLFYVMQAAAENRIPLIVLDRPDLIGGSNVEGPVLNTDMRSFIGMTPLPIVYGMTVGELAELFAGENWIEADSISLRIIKMSNWNRKSSFADYKLPWINPSPNIPDVETALIYPGMALLEGTNVSEGRGTEQPFKVIGAPFINPAELINELDSLGHPGLSIKPAHFIPVKLPGKADKPKYENTRCSGIQLKVEKSDEFKPVDFGIRLLFALHKLYPEKFKFEPAFFDKLAGDKSLRKMLMLNRTPLAIVESWKFGIKRFLEKRFQYLLY